MKTTQLCLLLAAFSSAVWLAGCASTPQSRIEDNPAAFAQLTPQEQTLVRSGQVGLGFSIEAVRLALGQPTRITNRIDAQGQVQIWHYAEVVYYDGAYIYGGGYWRGWGHRRWGWGGGVYPAGPVATYDRFRVTFKDGHVVAISQESGY